MFSLSLILQIFKKTGSNFQKTLVGCAFTCRRCAALKIVEKEEILLWLIFMETQGLIFSFTECSSWSEPRAPEMVSCFISGGLFLCLWCGLLLHSGCSQRFYTEVQTATINCVDCLEDKEIRWLEFCSRSHVAWFFTPKKPNTFFKWIWIFIVIFRFLLACYLNYNYSLWL